VALVLAWRAFVESTAEAGAGLLGGTSADFNSAVLQTPPETGKAIRHGQAA